MNKTLLLRKLIFAFVLMASVSTSNAQTYPADVLNLADWKVTMPEETAQAGNPDEYKQPQLATFKHDVFFHLNTAKDGVIFRAPVNGATTSGSGYPRSELRERPNGIDAAWSSNTPAGTYSMMYIDQRVNKLPIKKKELTLGQIHDGSSDVIVFRLEGSKLFMDHGGTAGVTLTSSYVLGTRFNCMFKVYQNKTESYYNGVLKETYNKSYTSAYFKAGAYTQSNCSTESSSDCNANNYGEVEIFSVLRSYGAPLSVAALESFSNFNLTYNDGKVNLTNIGSTEALNLSVLDLQGKTLETIAIPTTDRDEQKELHLKNHLTTGMYIFMISGSNGEKYYSKKCVVAE